MSEYRRYYVPGAMVFFTLVTHQRRQILTSEVARECLRSAFVEVRKTRPFAIDAMVLLPDHLHAIWTLPIDDPDYSVRWRRIKEEFSRRFRKAGGREGARSASRRKRKERGYWQRRFWDHVIRDEIDFERHLDYIHYNPVKHGLVTCVRDWPYSSFGRWVERGVYPSNWGMGVLRFDDLDETAME